MADEAVQVAVRIRPFLPREKGQRQIVTVQSANVLKLKVLTTQLAGPPQEEDKVFSFDHCLSSVKPNDSRRDEPHAPPITQEQVYEAIGQNLLSNALEGYNSCLFAYGQTGSGKTYTVLGHERDPGLIPRLCQNLFTQEYEELRVSASFLEIYNEQLKDLLNPQMKGRKPLYVHQHPQLGVYVPHLTEAPVGSHDECMALLDFGSKIRATSQTNMNSTSSRSHALFILRITFPIKDESRTRIRNSTLNLIDLAGSERVKKSGAAGQRMREGQNINSSLSVLGQVISKLAQGKFKHVPFRQSKLTYLLTDALSGNSKTHMVAAISPALSEMEETLGTLRFASSVKKVRTHAVSNEQDVGESDLLLQTMRSEAEELKAAALKASVESPQQARRYMKSAEAVEHAVLSIQTRIDKTMWSQAQLKQQEASRLRCEALAGLSLPFNIGGMLGGQSEHAVTANSPYLLNISDDISLAGRLLYFLPEGPPISIGSEESNRIRLMGLGIPDHLCDILVVAGGKGVEVQHCGRGGRLVVDGVPVSDNQAIALYNGARIIFGRAFAFRLVIPLASQGGGRGIEDEDLLMRAAALPSPFPACEGDTLQRLRLLIETSVAPVLGETECAEIMRRAGEVHNDVDEANELLKEIEQTPLQVLEVGLLLRAPPERPTTTEHIVSQNNRQPQLVVHCSRLADGELLSVWPIPRFYQHLEELRDFYQQRCDRKRQGLPVDAHRGVSMAWEDAVSSPTNIQPPRPSSIENSSDDSDGGDR
ncbi:unnamed protein product [Durusdinium trenchii]|uniref:Kinesin-like protein n=3 Tax=Durusdinium trenchii TaxID=1381693 RepID=A0ABP0L5X0_9DINO